MASRGVLRVLQGGRIAFWCPGCEELHQVRVRPAPSPSWDFNGDYDRPTFSPSILVRTGHYVPGHKAGDNCWCTFCAEDKADGNPPGFSCKQCHSFVRDGHIQFLGDCSHALAGKTVKLEPFHGT